MSKTEIEQIRNIIKNFEEQKKHIPFLSELERHPVFGPLFKTLNQAQKENVKKIIRDYIVEKLENFKTKGWELFKRFYDMDNKTFREFRDLNEDYEANEKKFQEVWKKVEKELFKYEWILTEPMLKQEKWLEKVVWAFYTIIFTFFPAYNNIG